MTRGARGPVALLRREAAHALPPTLFFLVAFNLIALTVALLARGAGASVAVHASATLAALVCGKAVLVADKLPFFNRYPDKPLIWNTLWKAALYMTVTLLLRVLERLISAAVSTDGLTATLTSNAQHFDWPRFWAVQMWLAVLFLGYAAFRELVGVIGRESILAIFFRAPTSRSER